MVEKNATIENETGLHARPASIFVEEAGAYEAEIKVIKDNTEVNAKSIMGIMSLGAEQGSEIVIQAKGSDAEAAADKLVNLIENGFDE